MNLRNPKEYCESLLVIRNKKQELVPLRFNEAQSNLYAVIRAAGCRQADPHYHTERAAGGYFHGDGGADVSGHCDAAQCKDPDRGP